jgi:pyruvate dehydrogenase E2 component (dihydrolipoamide acetyltransferase)
MRLSRVRRLSGAHLAESWRNIPHVTNFHEADVTELESFRLAVNAERRDTPKLTLLSFLIKATATTLKRFPEFNASLDGEDLVLKRYYNLGFAVDTHDGLLVPVIRDVDQKGLLVIGTEVGSLAERARQGKLKASDIEGGSFSISSLGAVPGSGFTPIINAPELAILGVSRTTSRLCRDAVGSRPRLMLPLSLSWDHRVLDGVLAARFLDHLAILLGELVRVAL